MTAVPADSRPAVEWVAEQLGDTTEGRMARWVDLAPRLTPTGSGAGRELHVDAFDGLATVCERLPLPQLSIRITAASTILEPIVRDRNTVGAVRDTLLQRDPGHVLLDGVQLALAVLMDGPLAVTRSA